MHWTLEIHMNTLFGRDLPQPDLWHIWHVVDGQSARGYMNVHRYHQHVDHERVPGPHPAGRGEEIYQQGSDLPELQSAGDRGKKSACRV